MSVQKEITLSGVGGQGLILSGTLLAEAAVVYDNKNATLASEYGTEARGTFAKSDVIISSEDIYFPDATKQDVIVCLHQIAYERYSGKLPYSPLIIYNSDEVTPHAENAACEAGIPIKKLSREAGNPATANIITIGIVVGLLECVAPEAAKQAISAHFAPKGDKVVDMNVKAFEKGLEVGRGLKR